MSDERKPLLTGRGALHFDHFCRATGLDPATVEQLMREGRIEGALWKDSDQVHPFGLFDDVLPSRDALVEMGLPVRGDYDPETLRSHEMPEDEHTDH